MRILILLMILFLNVNYAMADAYTDFVNYQNTYLADEKTWQDAQDAAVAGHAAVLTAQAAATAADNSRDSAWSTYTASLANGDPIANVDGYYDTYVLADAAASSSNSLVVTRQATAGTLQSIADSVVRPIDSIGLAQIKFQADQTLSTTEHWLVYNSALRDYNDGVPVTPKEEQMLIDAYQAEHEAALTAQAVADAAAAGTTPNVTTPLDSSSSGTQWAALATAAVVAFVPDDPTDLLSPPKLVDSASVGGANLNELLSMNSVDDYSVIDHLEQTFDMGCAGFDSISFIKGACTWLKCGFLYCKIKVSAIVEHKSPDLMVEVAATDKDSIIGPIEWVSGTVDTIGKFLHKLLGLDVGALKSGVRGSQTSDGGGKKRENFNVLDVTVIGNPYLILYEVALGQIMSSLNVSSFCYSKVIPFKPYYTTKTDPEWRLGLGERLNSLGDSVTTNPRNINNYGSHFDFSNPVASLDAALGIYWGYLYPRMGFTKNQSIYRSAGLTAQRVGSIISYNTGDTGGINLHVSSTYDWPPSETGGNTKSYGISSVTEHSDKHAWQLNYPQGKRGSGCYRFPDVAWDGANYINGGGPHNQMSNNLDLTSDSNSYVFTLWRTYKCCTRKGKFLFDVQW